MIKNFKLLIFFITLANVNAIAQILNYGLTANLNYTTIGSTNKDFSGRGLYSVGAYISRPYSTFHTNRYLNKLEFMFEPTINFVSFREVQNDTRYNNNYLDAAFYTFFYPEKMDGDLKLFAGLRPSFLINHQTELIEFGVYRPRINDPTNFNRNGDVDLLGAIGISVSMGEVVKGEIKYLYSFTNGNKTEFIKGRPSSFEFGIRFSAVDVRNKFTRIEETTGQKVKKLKTGSLLVMLTTVSEKEKNYILQTGSQIDLGTHEFVVKKSNENIVQAFKQGYSFSKVLYFMDTSAYKVSAGNFNNVFVNEKFEPYNPAFDSTNFLIASFSEDVSAFTHKVDYGLHIFNKNFEALPKPFLSSDNYFGANFGGDPLNFFRKVKLYYQFQDYLKIVKRFNNRLERASLIIKN
ncbi:MAG: hypothetical protein ACK4K9_01760 [Bacteroidia bacterium]